jgi:acyl-CoA synthetase (NDP forming)
MDAMSVGTVEASCHRLRPLVDPASIAIFGASADPKRLGGVPISLLRQHKFAGAIYPINPKYQEIDGLTCYPDIAALPGPVDVIVIAVGAADVVPVLRQAAAKGIRAAVIYAAGFAEAGDAEGVALQAELVRCADELGIVVGGPNCMGFGNLDNHAYSTFTAVFRTVPPPAAPRTVGLVTQSGSVCSAVYAAGRAMDVRFNLFINTGNEACVDFSEYLEYLADRPGTEAIVGYLEGLRDGVRFQKVAARMRDEGRPLALLKAGGSDKGIEAARLHTGADAGSAAAYRAVFERLGVIPARDILHLADIAYLSRFRARTSGRRVAILTISGALGALLSDLFTANGVSVPTLSQSVQALLRQGVPRYGMAQNPVDFTGNIVNSHTFVGDALDAILASGEVDFVVLYASGFLIDRFAESLAQAAQKSPRMVAALATGTVAARATLEEAGVAVFEDPARAAAALSSMACWHDNRRLYEGIPVAPAPVPSGAVLEFLKAARAADRKNFSGVEAAKLLAAFGVTMPCEVVEGASQRQGDGAELCIDIRNDPILGPVLRVSPAGDWPEALNDHALASLPLPRDFAIRSMKSLRGWPLLARTCDDAAIAAAGVVIENLGSGVLMLGSSFERATVMLWLSSRGQSKVAAVDVVLTNG